MSTPNAGQLQAMAGNLGEYLRRVLIETDDGPRPWADVADPWQRADMEGVAPALVKLVAPNAAEPSVRRAWWERPRGHSKTADLAALTIRPLAFSRRRLRGVWAAADKDQGLLGLEAIKALSRLNPWIAELLEIRADRVVNPRTDSALQFITSDAATSYGELPDFVVADELSHWKDRALWDSLFSSVGKRRDCVMLVGTNAGWQDSWQWETRAAVQTDPRWRFSSLPGPVASWITPDRLDEQRRLLPSQVYARLWENVWGSGSGGDALTEDEITRALCASGPMARPEWGWQFALGLDLGLKRDFAAAVVLGRHTGGLRKVNDDGELRPVNRLSAILADIGGGLFPDDEVGSHTPQVRYEETKGTGKTRLAAVRIWKPEGGEIDLDGVEAEVRRLAGVFGCGIFADPWEGRAMCQRFRKAGLRAEAVDATGGNLETQALELLAAFRENRVELFDHPQLLADLRALRIVERSYGFRLESPRSKAGGHGDAASAFGLALLGLKRIGRRGVPLVPHKQLAY
jgi:hypothetical protein